MSIQTIIPKVIMSILLNKYSDEALAQQQSKRLKSGSLYDAPGIVMRHLHQIREK